MGVEVACGEFDSLAEHHAEGDVDGALSGDDLEGFADVVAVFHEGLLGQVGVEGFDEAFALAAAVDDDAVGA